MKAPEPELTNSDLFALRMNEVIAFGLGQTQPREIPDWVWRVAKKIWADLMPSKTPLPNEDDRDPFICGLGVALMASGKMDVAPHSAVIRDLTTRGEKDGDGGLAAELLAKLRQGEPTENLFSREQLGGFLYDFLHLAPARRMAFVHGLLLGTRLLNEFRNGMPPTGGSPRRNVHLALWLNWPQLDAMESVAAVYELLANRYRQAGKDGLLGDWERFKKITQDVKFKVSRRRKGKSDG
jgi:hypothetical protein